MSKRLGEVVEDRTTKIVNLLKDKVSKKDFDDYWVHFGTLRDDGQYIIECRAKNWDDDKLKWILEILSSNKILCRFDKPAKHSLFDDYPILMIHIWLDEEAYLKCTYKIGKFSYMGRFVEESIDEMRKIIK